MCILNIIVEFLNHPSFLMIVIGFPLARRSFFRFIGYVSPPQQILAGKNISYVNEIPEGITGVGDSMLISSVVNNYLSNGVSHIDGERILRASAEDLGEEQITIC